MDRAPHCIEMHRPRSRITEDVKGSSTGEPCWQLRGMSQAVAGSDETAMHVAHAALVRMRMWQARDHHDRSVLQEGAPIDATVQRYISIQHA